MGMAHRTPFRPARHRAGRENYWLSLGDAVCDRLWVQPAHLSENTLDITGLIGLVTGLLPHGQRLIRQVLHGVALVGTDAYHFAVAMGVIAMVVRGFTR